MGQVYPSCPTMSKPYRRFFSDNDGGQSGSECRRGIHGQMTILEKMGLQEKVTPLQARKKWDNLKKKYKDCKYPGSGEGVSGKPTAATWPWFALMDEVIGQRPSIRLPVLISSLPEDTPGWFVFSGQRVENHTEWSKESFWMLPPTVHCIVHPQGLQGWLTRRLPHH
ncbi:unnamed protein product [Oreochromis niloticus]|nr:unnamed protein product [Mustela putorius furo]